MNVGIICDLSYAYSMCFQNYYYSVNNIFSSVKIINSIDDINDIDIIFIGNDHYKKHLDVWCQNSFIEKVNKLNIKMVVFTAETILSSCFPHNEVIQKKLERFNNLYQYVIDINDMIKLNKMQMRGLVTKNVKGFFHNDKKIDGCVFIGKYKENEYVERRKILDNINKFIPVTIIDRINNWHDYMNTMAKYRFVLSPISNGNFFALRFYEILAVGSIPIHQVLENTLSYYPIEAEFDDCIYFQNLMELKEKVLGCKLEKSHSEIWMESHIQEILEKDKIL